MTDKEKITHLEREVELLKMLVETMQSRTTTITYIPYTPPQTWQPITYQPWCVSNRTIASITTD